jgi:hypothetical protein
VVEGAVVDVEVVGVVAAEHPASNSVPAATTATIALARLIMDEEGRASFRGVSCIAFSVRSCCGEVVDDSRVGVIRS